MEVIRDGYKFRQDLLVPCYDTDSSFCLRPAAFMDMAQEIAYWAAQKLGFGYDDLQERHTAWVLSRFHFSFIAPPRWRDPVSLLTWHKGGDGLLYLRDFQLKSPSGEVLVAGTSSWAVLDVRTRRLVRPEQISDLLPVPTDVEDAIEEPAPKVVLPKDLELSDKGCREVSYSDIDILGHTNNARYIVWAMDCIDFHTVTSRRVSDVQVVFHKETTPGTSVRLLCGTRMEGESEAWYVEGRLPDGKPAFTAKFVYRP